MPCDKSYFPPFTSEQQLTTQLKQDIAEFWQHGVYATFQGVDNIRINYAIFQHSSESIGIDNNVDQHLRKSIVIVSGRSECYLKYQELCFDLFQQGFDIFILDHRGQGLSQRIINHPQKGYVLSFEHYIDDLATFIDDIILSKNPNKPYLLGHSMGGAIVARFIQRFPNTAQAAVLSSPMIGISSGAIPHFVASVLIKTINKINQWFAAPAWYFLGHKNYTVTHFQDNILMHSEVRYKIFNQLYQTAPNIQLGGVTVKWLREALKVREAIFKDINKITIPVQVLQSGDERIVDNQVQNEFCQQLHQAMPSSCLDGKPIAIEGAFHELFFETDALREQALTATLDWFSHH